MRCSQGRLHEISRVMGSWRTLTLLSNMLPRHIIFAIFEKRFKMTILHFSDFFGFKSIQQYWINLVCQTQISNEVEGLDPTDPKFPFEYITLKHKQVGDFNSKRALYEFCLCYRKVCFSFNYISITYNMLLLQRILIQYCIKFSDKYFNYLHECELQ